MKPTTQLLRGMFLACAFATPAFAWPTAPIRIVVPYPAGGTSDFIARTVGKGLSEQLATPVIVDNRAGASGNIGAQFVARSAPDGYTLMVGGPNNFASNQFLYKGLTYNIEKDLLGISVLAHLSNVLLVAPGSPAKDVREFVALSKVNPNAFNCATTGIATTSHLTLELFKVQSGADLQHIPMKNSAGVVTELLGNRVHCAFDNLPVHLQHLRRGGYRALAVTGGVRSPQLPDVPTLAEAGYPGVVSTSWFALAAPAGTPPAIVERLSQAVRQVLSDPETIKTIAAAGFAPAGTTPMETERFFAQEIVKWKRVIESAGIKPE